jgi:mRNA-degrading endonuclease RelE of RelBE toxin-antitoxin system
MILTKVRISQQVWEYLRLLAPGPRRNLRLGLRLLEREVGDILPLKNDLEGFHRLRVQSHRVIFRYVLEGKERVISCEFAEQRDIIYQLFSRVASFVVSRKPPRPFYESGSTRTKLPKRS